MRNCVPELEEIIAEIRKKINFDQFNLKSVKLGKTNQKNLNGGKSGDTIHPEKPEENEENEKKVKVKFSDLEIATTMVTLTLGHDENDRDFGNFCIDCKYLFTLEGIRAIGAENLEKIWSIVESQIKNLRWHVN